LSKVEDATPNAGKFMRDVLRGSTYSFSTAIADIVDNAIEAKATDIDVHVDLKNIEVMIFDNGIGMDDDTHRESMKIAAETRSYSDSDLGKYGTGMKAASLSQAARVIVATRAKNSTDITVRCLDMDHIVEVNDWAKTTLVLDEKDLPPVALEHLKSTHGTAVIWQKLDRVVTHKAITSEGVAREELLNQMAILEPHLAMVFHRFLDGTIPTRSNISLRINRQLISPWDPFARDEATIVAVSEKLPINGFEVGFTGYVLPGEKEFSSKQAFASAAGPKRWNEGQGFYVYRNYRLIRWGGWLRQRGVDEHVKLARIALDIPSSLDTIFTVNVAKSAITLPESVSRLMTPWVKKVTLEADKRYRGQSKLAGINPRMLPGIGDLGRSTHVRKMTADTFATLMSRIAASEGLSQELDAIKKAVRDNSPATADEIGW
jgi:hypothetical protein